MKTDDASNLAQIEQEVAKRIREIDIFYTNFLNTICFELRTPLSAIIGYSQLLLENADEPITKTQKDLINAIQQAGRHLLEFQYDVLDMVRIAGDFLPLDFGNVDLRKVIEGVAPIRFFETDSSIKFEQNVPNDLPIIQADGRRVDKIIQNLILNSVRLTEEGKITLTVTHNDDWVTVKIADTGSGIPAGALAAFNSAETPVYWRMDYRDWELAVSRYLIEKHGGTMQIETQEGKGSLVTFTLPIRQPEGDDP
jgi:signal transduction histidine kinase